MFGVNLKLGGFKSLLKPRNLNPPSFGGFKSHPLRDQLNFFKKEKPKKGFLPTVHYSSRIQGGGEREESDIAPWPNILLVEHPATTFIPINTI